jgi:hypothetical protein
MELEKNHRELYGALTGFVSGSMAEIGTFTRVKNNAIAES